MRFSLALGALLVATALALAGAAVAAPNTGSIAVSYTPMTLGGSSSSTIHIATPQSDDSIVQINIYTNATFASLGTPGTQIGSVEATAFAHDAGLNLPLSGPVTADDAARHTTDVCSPGQNQAVWDMNLSAAGQTLVIPIYVNKTAGAATAFGTTNLKICLPPWDVPVGAPGRSFEGAQLLDAKLTLQKILTAPTSAGVGVWEMLATPYTPGKGTPNLAGTFEARALVPVPVSLGIKAVYRKQTRTYALAGRVTEGGAPLAAGTTLTVYRGSSPGSLRKLTITKSRGGGAWSLTGRLGSKHTVYFQVAASVPERDDTATGCQNPAPTTVAAAGCVSATLSAWSARSTVVRVKP